VVEERGTMSEYERCIIYTKQHVIILWNIMKEIHIINFKTAYIERKENQWEIWLFAWENQKEAYHFIVKDLKIKPELTRQIPYEYKE
jgi:hypothetical protein